MIGELDLAGVFVSPVLVSAVLAVIASFIVRKLLAWAGAYRFIWHPALFDGALFIIAWAIVSACPLPEL